MLKNRQNSFVPTITLIMGLLLISLSYTNCGEGFEAHSFKVIDQSSVIDDQEITIDDGNNNPPTVIVPPVVIEPMPEPVVLPPDEQDNMIVNPIPANYDIKVIYTGTGFNEGPLYYKATNTIIFTDFNFSDHLKNKIVSYDLNTLELSEVSNPLGLNGKALTTDGVTISAGALTGRTIYKKENNSDEHRPLDLSFEGKKLNAPNDVYLDSDQNIFFTDPTYNRKATTDGEQFLSFQGVYYIDRDNNLHNLVRSGFAQPNGILLSPDQSTLYVSDSDANLIKSFELVRDDGQPIKAINEKVFYQAPALAQGVEGKIDGMAIDRRGNVYASGSHKITVLSPTGEVFGQLDFGEQTTNAAFGGTDNKTLFVTGAKKVYSVNMDVPGLIVTVNASDNSNPGNPNDMDNTDVQAAGAPSAPVGVSSYLTANNWTVLNWQPSQDQDGQVVAYKIYRNGEHIDTVKGGESNSFRQLYHATNTFIDCNYIESSKCGASGPKPGETYSYQIAAVDNDNKESAKSQSLQVQMKPLTANSIRDNVKSNSQYKLVFEENFSNVSKQELSQKWEFRRVWDLQGKYSSNPQKKAHYDNDSKHQQVINGEAGYMIDLNNDSLTQIFNPYQSSQNGSALKISAQPKPAGMSTPAFADSGTEISASQQLPYVSGLLRSKQKFKKGFFEARMKLSGHHGMLSTFYLFHSTFGVGSGQKFGASEIDILEYLGGSESLYGQPNRGRLIYQTYHFKSRQGDGDYPLHRTPTMSFEQPDKKHFSDDFHTYSVFWDTGIVIWYIDDKEVRRVEGPAVVNDPKEIILSLVVGGEWAGAPNDGTTSSIEIDYVRVYQKDESSDNNGASTNTQVNPPKTINLQQAGSGTVNISWDSVEGALGYNVYRDNQYIQTVINKTSTQDKGLNAGASHTYYIVAFGDPAKGNNSYSPKSEEKKITINP